MKRSQSFHISALIRLCYLQWRQNLLCMMALSFGFCLVLLVNGLEQSAQHKLKNAMQSVNQHQLIISHHGVKLSPANTRLIQSYLYQTLDPEKIYPISIHHAQLNLQKNNKSVAFMHTSSQTMQELNLLLSPPTQLVGQEIAWSSKALSKNLVGFEFNHLNKKFILMPALEDVNIALRLIFQTENLIWIPHTHDLELAFIQPSHFILGGISNQHLQHLSRSNLAQKLNKLIPGHSWNIDSPYEILIQTFKLNENLMFTFWLASILILCSGLINLSYLLIQNVKHRQQEIALRVMLGAKSHHLFLQFALECIVLSYLCLFIGFCFSYLFSYVLQIWNVIEIQVWQNLSPLPFLIITTLALIISIYPARLAIKTNPKQLFYNI